MKKNKIGQVSFQSSLNIQGLQRNETKTMDVFLFIIPSRIFIRNVVPIKTLIPSNKQ